ncbi:MAG: hypothetical protein R6U58_05100 [Bacteroidales bacterium]
MVRRILLFVGLIFFFCSGSLADDLRLTGYIKYMNTVSFNKFDSPWMVDNLYHNRLNFRWKLSGNLSFAAGMRNRFIYGDYVSNIPGYKDIVSQDNGCLDFLTGNILSNQSSVLTTTFDRFYMEYNTSKLSVTLGRQRINWGQSFVWNPNDIFNAYSFFDFDYEERPGSDALRIRYFPGFTSVADIAVKIDSENNVTAAALYRFNSWGYDIQFLGGIIGATDYVAGAGWSGSISSLGFNGELSYFHPQNKATDSLGVALVNTGINYMFGNSLHLSFEAIYNGYFSKLDMNSFTDLYFMPLSVKTIAFSKFSWFGQVSYPVHPLLNASLSAMYLPSLEDGYFAMPSLAYSAGNNLEISLLGQRFSGKFGNKSENLNMFFMRLKLSF